MKLASLTLAALVAATSLTAPAFAAGKAPHAATSQSEEFSASKRKRIHTPYYKYVDPYTNEIVSGYRYLVPSSDFDGGYYAGEYAWRRSLGQCVEDLGYGRWKGC